MTSPNYDSSTDINTILEIERRTMEAIKQKDRAALMSILAEDFTHRTPAGQDAGRSEFLKGISDLPLEVLSISADNLKVNVYGETAVLTGIQRVTVRDAEGKEESGAGAFTDVFVKRQEEWLLVLAYSVDLPTGWDTTT
jgi:ketosteroid isomerase-like protein